MTNEKYLAAIRALKLLTQAYDNWAGDGGSIEWSDVDDACEAAKEVLAMPGEITADVRPEVLADHEPEAVLVTYAPVAFLPVWHISFQAAASGPQTTSVGTTEAVQRFLPYLIEDGIATGDTPLYYYIQGAMSKTTVACAIEGGLG